MTLEELSGMTIWEYRTWQLYYQLEPWGEERDDLRTGIVASTIANGVSAFGRVRKQYKPKDFMPEFDQQRAQTQRGMRSLLIAAASAAQMVKQIGQDTNRTS